MNYDVPSNYQPPITQNNPLKVHGRRQGRPLRQHKASLMKKLLPIIEVPIPPHPQKINPNTLFNPTASNIWLEIGFGGGEHLAHRAEQNPDVGFIGAEFFVNGIASLLSHIHLKNLTNIRVHPKQVQTLLEALPDSCLDKCFLLFPDPWPKKRHEDRRFINSQNLDRLARVMKPKAELHLATDDPILLPWMLKHALSHPEFIWLQGDIKNCLKPPENWTETRYERKARIEGKTPHFLRFSRK